MCKKDAKDCQAEQGGERPVVTFEERPVVTFEEGTEDSIEEESTEHPFYPTDVTTALPTYEYNETYYNTTTQVNINVSS